MTESKHNCEDKLSGQSTDAIPKYDHQEQDTCLFCDDNAYATVEVNDPPRDGAVPVWVCFEHSQKIRHIYEAKRALKEGPKMLPRQNHRITEGIAYVA